MLLAGNIFHIFDIFKYFLSTNFFELKGTYKTIKDSRRKRRQGDNKP